MFARLSDRHTLTRVSSTLSLIERRQASKVIVRAALLAFVAGIYYFALMSGLKFNIHLDQGRGLEFNDMLLRMLRGDFTIDPAIIGVEALVFNGKTYTYLGVFPAVIRLPLLPFFDLRNEPVAVLACTISATGTVFFYGASVLTVAQARLSAILTVALTVTCAFAGIPSYLAASSVIYHEPIRWAACLSAAYVFILTRSIVAGTELRPAAVAVLAILAGICVHTRISTALGLCLATTLIVLRSMANRFRGAAGAWYERAAEAIKPNLAPILILAIFTLLAGFVNFMRWGDPFEFVNLARQVYWIERWPDRLHRLLEQGTTSAHRFWFGLQYYYFPIWLLPDESGRSIFAAWMEKNLDGAEMPPSSLLLTDTLWVGFAAFGIAQLIRRRPWGDAQYTVGLAALALSIPAALTLTHIYMALRYRVEFQPAIMLLAVYGLLELRPCLKDGATILRRTILFGAACSIIFSQLIIMARWPAGPSHGMNLRTLYNDQYETVISKIQRVIYRVRRSQW
jgi:hypothetical protein